MITFKEEKHHVDLINLEDYIVDRIRIEAFKITSVYGLDTIGKILLDFMNTENKVPVMSDSAFGIKCLFMVRKLIV